MAPKDSKCDRLDAAVKIMGEARSIAGTMAAREPPMAEVSTTLPQSLRARRRQIRHYDAAGKIQETQREHTELHTAGTEDMYKPIATRK